MVDMDFRYMDLMPSAMNTTAQRVIAERTKVGNLIVTFPRCPSKAKQ